MKKHFLESDDRLFSLGFKTHEDSFVSYYQAEESTFTQNEGIILTAYVNLEEDALDISRQIYTVWDVLGDVGGLADML